MTIIEKQKYDLAKFLRLIFLVPPNENTSSRIKPIKGIENKISYPKYPHIDIGYIHKVNSYRSYTFPPITK